MQHRPLSAGSVIGNRISVRADEGEPFELGTIRSMRNDVIFHALSSIPMWHWER
ncbi:MAG: hypothetical protein M3R15_14705 [Acidobacteriota bacterium]|nr:hypothetical protein [Acidobacteriota bacterium]